MSTITKEWLQKAISQYEIMRDESPDGLNEYDSNELAALRIALASLEAEVVGYVDAEYAELLKSGHIESCSVYAEPGEGGITVFSAPPAPVSVPDEATPENIEILASTYAPCGVTYQWDRDECNAAADSWNACRAAMLQGAEPSKMSGIMPDYEGGVMTQRECFQAGWEAHHSAMLQAGAPVQFGWSKGHFGYHTIFNAIGKAVNIQGSALSISVSAFEDAMLAAAPQQEVK